MVQTIGVTQAITNHLFVKVDRQSKQYGLSNKFTLSNPLQNELYDVVKILKRLMRE